MGMCSEVYAVARAFSVRVKVRGGPPKAAETETRTIAPVRPNKTTRVRFTVIPPTLWCAWELSVASSVALEQPHDVVDETTGRPGGTARIGSVAGTAGVVRRVGVGLV